MIFSIGNKEVLNLSHMGTMSRNRASKIRLKDYPEWKFPSMRDMDYLRRLHIDYNICGLTRNMYWTNQGVLETSCVAYKISSGTGYMAKMSSAIAGLILIRDL